MSHVESILPMFPGQVHRSHPTGEKMNVMSRVALLTAGIGLALGMSVPATAANGHFASSNAVNNCQAFTPGVSNTIRNRVTGAENVGSSTIAVACSFGLSQLYGSGSSTADDVTVYFKNNSAASASVSCTVLPGDFVDGIGTAQNMSKDIAPGAQDSISFTGPWSVFGLGVNCNLPQNVVMTLTVLRYQSND